MVLHIFIYIYVYIWGATQQIPNEYSHTTAVHRNTMHRLPHTKQQHRHRINTPPPYSDVIHDVQIHRPPNQYHTRTTIRTRDHIQAREPIHTRKRSYSGVPHCRISCAQIRVGYPTVVYPAWIRQWGTPLLRGCAFVVGLTCLYVIA